MERFIEDVRKPKPPRLFLVDCPREAASRPQKL
jgi:hypothetical protein